MEWILFIIVIVAIGVAICRPTPQQYVMMPIEPVQSSGIGCGPVLLIALLLAALLLFGR